MRRSTSSARYGPSCDSVSQITHGTVSITPTPNAVTTFHVDFGMEFDVTPMVLVNARTTNPSIVSVSAGSLARDGFDIFLHRTTSTATTVDWIAFCDFA